MTKLIMEVTYYFARLNLLANYDDKTHFIYEGLSKGAQINFRGFNYGFYDIELFNNMEYITGFLVKYRDIVDTKPLIQNQRREPTLKYQMRLSQKQGFFSI